MGFSNGLNTSGQIENTYFLSNTQKVSKVTYNNGS